MTKIAIFGIGNVLMGDDGIGPAVAHFLENNFRFPEGVVVEDLGTPSLSLPGYLTGHDTVIFIDAVAAEAPPGTICCYSRDEIVHAPAALRISPHEPSIDDALRVLDFAGNAPRDVTLIGVVPETLSGGLTLSPGVSEAVPRAADAVIAALAERGIQPLDLVMSRT